LCNASLKETPMFASSHISLLKFTAVGGLVVFIGLRAPVAAGELAQNSEAGEPHMPVLVGPMPPFGETIKIDSDLWKIIAWIRSINRKDNDAR